MFWLEKYCRKHWTTFRARGKARFVIVFGVLWGLVTASLSSLVFWLGAPRNSFTSFAAVVFALFPVFGLLVGADLWQKLERKTRDDRG